jgi:hypothetical protein
MEYSGDPGSLILEKNLKSKFSCQTPSNKINKVNIYTSSVALEGTAASFSSANESSSSLTRFSLGSDNIGGMMSPGLLVVVVVVLVVVLVEVVEVVLVVVRLLCPSLVKSNLKVKQIIYYFISF